jgi:hypothetical protein
MIPPLLKAQTKTPGTAVFGTPQSSPAAQSSRAASRFERYPLPPWTVEHWMAITIATPESVMTSDEAIHCPNSWTLDHWMNAISPIPEISYDQPSSVQAWKLDAID